MSAPPPFVCAPKETGRLCKFTPGYAERTGNAKVRMSFRSNSTLKHNSRAAAYTRLTKNEKKKAFKLRKSPAVIILMTSIRFQVTRTGPKGKASDLSPSLCADDEQEQETNQTTLDKVEWPSALKRSNQVLFDRLQVQDEGHFGVCVRINTKLITTKKKKKNSQRKFLR